MDRFVVQDKGNQFTEWEPNTLAELGLKEADLERALIANPGSLLLDQLGLLYEDVVVFDQCGLRSGSGHLNIPDIILLTDHGDVIVVEVKRLSNPDLRGRSVVSQVVGYAATLASEDEEQLVKALTKDACSDWEEVCIQYFTAATRPELLAEIFRTRFEAAELQLVIACDEAPPSLATWVRNVGRQSALAFDLHVIEVRPMTSRGRDFPIAWVPRCRISTEIIHRTSVVVRTEGSASVSVEVTSDSAEGVKSAVEASGARGRRRNGKEVVVPAAKRLGLSVDALWRELDAIHQHAVSLEWQDLRAAIGQQGDAGPYLRGTFEDGYTEGRFGVNLLENWKPSVFVGAYLLGYDHKQELLSPDDGGDFSLIIDVNRNDDFDGDSYAEHEIFTRLRSRLQHDSGIWDFADHHANRRRNRWHPLYLRRPLYDVLAGAKSFEERQRQWVAAARDALRILLEGGELAELHQELFGAQIVAEPEIFPS